jgi:peptidoglycan/LPS O-acetylase OafA/YrhL
MNAQACVIEKRSSPSFLPEADGLRALAIAAVVIYHTAPQELLGGFLGVDVFFVLSGFLISRLLIARHEQGSFSMKHFYQQRAKRLLPVFLAMQALVWGLAWNLFFPKQLMDLGSSSFAASLALSNYCFAGKTGYFDASAEANPLLHTWSLGVEEQFYFLFPVLFSFFWRQRSTDIRGNSSRFILGFGFWMGGGWLASCILTRWWPLHGFYGLPSRAWELGAGVGIALLEQQHKRLSDRCAHPMAWLGLIMCVASFFVFGKESAAPGPIATIPVLGTALLLWTRAGGVGSVLWKIATLAPLRYLGRISYALYLFHWPLLVFQKFDGRGSPVIAVAIAVLLAVVTHHAVENPVRHCARPVILRRLGLGGLLLALALAGFAKYVRVNKGFVDAPCQEAYSRVLPETRYIPTAQASLIPIGIRSGTPEVLLLGDSHAESLVPVLDSALKAAGKTGAYWWAPGNFPGKGVATSRLSTRLDADLDRLAQGPWKTVFICSNWQGYLNFKPGGTKPPKLENHFSTPQEGFAILEQGLLEVVRAFAHQRVILIHQLPSLDEDVPMLMARRLINKEPFPENRFPIAFLVERNVEARRFVERIEKNTNVTTVDPWPVFSDGVQWRYHDGIHAFYRDLGHLSHRGAAELVPKLLEQL